MLALVRLLATLVTGYLLGSVPVANAVARRHAVGDLRDVGDRNPGYWNARETIGRRAALPVFAGDVAKGSVAAAVGVVLARPGQWWLPYVATGAAMVGHALPVWSGFRGGRSVLTFVGGVVVCAPAPAAVAIGACTATTVASRRFDVGARVGVAVFPIAQFALQGRYRTAASGVLMTFIGLRFAQAAASGRRSAGLATSDA
jgi:acyl phosphate:glycerol-3-phosphate acyltransferase